jgi:hypothetical protein
MLSFGWRNFVIFEELRDFAKVNAFRLICKEKVFIVFNDLFFLWFFGVFFWDKHLGSKKGNCSLIASFIKERIVFRFHLKSHLKVVLLGAKNPLLFFTSLKLIVVFAQGSMVVMSKLV